MSQALSFGILVLRLIMPRRDDRERSRTRHLRGRSESPPRKARRRNDRDDDSRQADSQDWLNSSMWQGSNGTASVPQPPSMPTSHNHSMNYLHHAPAPFPPTPCLAPYHPTPGLPISLDPCHRAPHELPAHQQPMPTQTTFANPSPPSSSATQSTQRLTTGSRATGQPLWLTPPAEWTSENGLLALLLHSTSFSRQYSSHS